MSTFSMTIAGEPVSSQAGFGVVNPATGEVFAEAPDCSPEQLEAAMQAASGALPDWRGDEVRRRELLEKAAEEILAAVEDIAPLLTAEQGKPLADARAEVRSVAVWCRYFAGLELPVEVIQDDDKVRIEVQRRPIGVVAAITPWNFPLSLAAWKIAPALRAGNTLVLKPSPFTPLATLKLGEILGRVLPPGVLNVISGRDPLGASMTAHPTPRKISFTGSVATGKHVAAAAATDLKRVTLELGGNDPAIVLDDIDPSAVAAKLFWSAFRNNGQVCSAVKRIYAPERLYDELVEALAEEARSARVGNGADDGVQLGPVNNAPQLERIQDLVRDAVANGATAVTGGRALDRPGYFYEPTILAGARAGQRIVDEEQFGPVLPVVPYRDVGEAIAQANASHFGLSASVWGVDIERAVDIADQLDCGTAWVNTHLALRPDQPFGGAKWSGIGVENGPWGLYGFTELKVVHRVKG